MKTFSNSLIFVALLLISAPAVNLLKLSQEIVYTQEDCLRDFHDEALKHHNIKRALHEETGPLIAGEEEQLFAQSYAESLRATNVFAHSDDENYGENLYMFGSTALFVRNENNCRKAAADAVRVWYNEIKDYNWTEPTLEPINGMVGHFTQVIWKDTFQVGCGFSIGTVKVLIKGVGYYKNYVTCNYSAPGNWVDELSDQVLPLKLVPSIA